MPSKRGAFVLSARKAVATFLCVLLASCGPAYAEPVFGDGFESEGAGGGEVPCQDLNPAGWNRVQKSWTQVFSAPDGNPSAAYPSGVSFPTPVGSSIGSGVVVPFTPFASQSVNLYFDQVQARPQDGYFKARPADSMFFGITNCTVFVNGVEFMALDLRPPDPNSPDPLLRPACRKIENSASIVWTTGLVPNPNACQLNPWQTYGLVIAPINPATGQHTCAGVANSAQGCDVGAILGAGVVP